MTRSSLLFVAVFSCACAEAPVPPGPCAHPPVELRYNGSDIAALDLLLVIDDSSSMTEEQAALAAELPRLVSMLATGDRDQDGDTYADGELNDPDIVPAVSVHFGVVTTDMGSGGHEVPTCGSPELGDDGLLRTEGSGDCAIAVPPFATFDPTGRESASAYAERAACMTRVGTEGCGYEQPLEAALKALSPSAPTSWTAPDFVAPTFFRLTMGHGDTRNDGFLRDDSLLAIVTLTNEDDCSARNPALFDDGGPYAATPSDLRCMSHPEALQPIERYVDGLLQIRRRPGMLVFIPIGGVPVDLLTSPGERPAWDALLCDDPATCDPRMRPEADPEAPTRPRASCVGPHGEAYPPARMMRVARGLEESGADVVVGSVCASRFASVFDELIGRVASELDASCLPRPLFREDDGSVGCEMHVLLPERIECESYPGSQPVMEDGEVVREGERALCVLAQLVPSDRSPGAPPPTDSGWYYDDFTALADTECSRIGLPRLAPSGTQLRLVCSTATLYGLGRPCDPGDAASCESTRAPSGGEPLSCDRIASTCEIPCTTDEDCAEAGVEGYVCDRRPLGEIDPRLMGNADPRQVCVNPTCG